MQNNSMRLILFIALSGIILFGYNMLFMPKTPQKTAGSGENTGGEEKGIAPEATKPFEPGKKGFVQKMNKESKIKSLPEHKYTLENGLLKITFSSIGAVIKSCKLKNYSDTSAEKEKKEFLELIPNKSSYTYHRISSPEYELADTTWKYDGTSESEGKKTITFRKTLKAGVAVIREYSLSPGSYLLDSKIKFSNNTGRAVAFTGLRLTWGPNIHFLPADVDKHKDGFYQFNKIVYPEEGDDTKTIDVDLKAKEDEIIPVGGKPGWVAFKDLYFMSSFIFDSAGDYKNINIRQNTGGFTYLDVHIKDLFVNENSSKAISVNSFIGPQEYKRLKQLKMEGVVELGWIRFLGIWMFYTLDFIHNLTHNYGFAILILTLLIRLLLWWPSHNSYRHMKETQQKMSIIKPRMETLKKVYKDDPQKMNEETMKLYKEYKINPFGGCLPMLLQLPIFIALYQTLINMVELKGASFIWWIQDLSRPDPFYILPIFMGASMFVQQKMSQASTAGMGSGSQQKIFLYGLPVFLTFLAFSWPSGLLLYWGMSNVLAIIQQVFVNKSKA